jgi:O-glycosyl hydrolase
MTLARVTIATSDFTPPPFYSYDDGAADPELQRFSVEKDEAFVLPAIKEALSAAGAPGTDTLRLFASPWSAPGWMKDSGVMSGGALRPENNALYAKYLLRFIEEYER